MEIVDVRITNTSTPYKEFKQNVKTLLSKVKEKEIRYVHSDDYVLRYLVQYNRLRSFYVQIQEERIVYFAKHGRYKPKRLNMTFQEFINYLEVEFTRKDSRLKHLNNI